MGDIFWLDWETQELFGWETEKSDLCVDALIKGIEAGDDFPPVPVCGGNGNTFFIADYRKGGDAVIQGGHTRAAAHYIEGKPLKCELLEEGKPMPVACVAIPDIILGNDKGEYAASRNMYPEYR